MEAIFKCENIYEYNKQKMITLSTIENQSIIGEVRVLVKGGDVDFKVNNQYRIYIEEN